MPEKPRTYEAETLAVKNLRIRPRPELIDKRAESGRVHTGGHKKPPSRDLVLRLIDWLKQE